MTKANSNGVRENNSSSFLYFLSSSVFGGNTLGLQCSLSSHSAYSTLFDIWIHLSIYLYFSDSSVYLVITSKAKVREGHA
jgi:hypothetical protein